MLYSIMERNKHETYTVMKLKCLFEFTQII